MFALIYPGLSYLRVLVDRSDVAVVPQRAYSCIGSLQDQITYPVIIPPEQRTPELVQKMLELKVDNRTLNGEERSAASSAAIREAVGRRRWHASSGTTRRLSAS